MGRARNGVREGTSEKMVSKPPTACHGVARLAEPVLARNTAGITVLRPPQLNAVVANLDFGIWTFTPFFSTRHSVVVLFFKFSPPTQTSQILTFYSLSKFFWVKG